MELDATGARANAPGLTKQAARAEKKRLAKERSAAMWEKVRTAAVALGKAFPTVLLISIAAAIVIAASVFDWYMSQRGWIDLLPGLGAFAGLGAAASVGFWYYGVHKALEQFQAKDWFEGGIWAGVAVAGYLICVTGVGLATLTNTSQARIAAEDSRKAYNALLVERDGLKSDLEVYSVEYWQAAQKADARTRDQRLKLAQSTLGMADLDVDKGCAQKLNFNQQRACAYWNGGIDPSTGEAVAGILTELEQDQRGLEKAKEKTDQLEALEKEIAGFTVKTGDETSRALVSFFQSEAAGAQAMLIIFAGLSALFLLAGGFFSAWFFRRISGKAT